MFERGSSKQLLDVIWTDLMWTLDLKSKSGNYYYYNHYYDDHNNNNNHHHHHNHDYYCLNVQSTKRLNTSMARGLARVDSSKRKT